MRPISLLTVVGLLAPAAVAAQAHPLDGLTAAEQWSVVRILRASGRVDDATRFLYAALREPPKAVVMAWRPGTPVPRRALVHLANGSKGFEADVDLVRDSLVSWREVTDRQYMAYNGEESVTGKLLDDARMKAALAKRDLADPSSVACFPINHGFFDLPEERGRRLARYSCFDNRGAVSSWGAPVGGLYAVVDMKSGEVLRVVDDGVRPRASFMGEHHAEAIGTTRPALPPIVISQPMGSGYRLDPDGVRWDRWRFHFRVDPRRGIVLSQVRYQDGDRERSILYQASLSELFVPYMDPGEPWSYQSYYDLGTYPAVFGGIASTLEPGSDCPAHATYFDSYIVSESGAPFQRPRVACLFERIGAEPAWRHARDGGRVVESRPRRDLVLRMIMGAGNYDYLFDWVFMQDGTIRVNAAATGMDQVFGARTRTATEGTNGAPREDGYGKFIAPWLVAVNHSHFFSFRLDFDVDGQRNSLMVDRLQTETQPASNPRRSVWKVNSVVAGTESEARRHSPMTAPELWRVVNPNVAGAYGDPVSYMVAGHGSMSLLSPDDYIRRRAGFTDFNLWATPYAPDELFAAGDYPTGGVAGEGLPKWTAANRSIENTDVVVWYTLGFHHVPRPEDYPIMPLELHGFELRPVGFFARNPALDVPKP